ncbi:autotransporter outer membrane beta-barrel domain-containing protein, partial [uncultured Novosphingobium sp.]|uniref:autotransporter outer membrane beta-barrel domain-containing protein n=1 Tax=uncultured Novosphingobium sp. TaxID=292277 RepID=UPI00258D563F
PEPYASAVQTSVERGLIVTRAMRSMTFAQADDTPRAFTFGQALGGWSRIEAGNRRGTAEAKSKGYGFLGGIGAVTGNWAGGAFVGYLEEDQTIAALAARTKTDGVIAGVHMRYDSDSISASASAFYDGAKAETRRALPAAGSADADYHLRGAVFDAKIAIPIKATSGLAMVPQLGTTWIRTRRDGVVEGGGSPFALTVRGDRQWAGFADASLKFEKLDTQAPLRPWITLGGRYQLHGRTPVAVAGFGGGGAGLVAYGASRARLSGTVDAGLDATVAPNVDLFVNGTSEFSVRGSRTGVNGGVKISF